MVLVVLLSVLKSFGQDQQLDYQKIKLELLKEKRVFVYADSINKIIPPFTLSKEIFKVAEELDKQNPSMFLQKALFYMDAMKWKEASFLYYTGYLRYKYFKAANPNFEIGNDGALFASLSSHMEPIIRYLRTNVDNFISVLKASQDWYVGHDYTFFSKANNPEKYLAQAANLEKLIDELEKNKQEKQLEWNEDRISYVKGIDKNIHAIDSILKSRGASTTQVTEPNKPKIDAMYLGTDSLIFCGKNIKAPIDCPMVMPGMVTCKTFAMVWRNTSSKEIDKEKKEAISQYKDPLVKFDCYILGNKLEAYKTQSSDGVLIQVFGTINGQGLMLHIALLDKKVIRSDADIPDFIGQVFRMKKN